MTGVQTCALPIYNKFSHPEEVISPHFFYPFEMRRAGIYGEVVVLVQIDGRGYPTKLKILYATQRLFALNAIQALKKARWAPAVFRHRWSDTWFYYKAVYSLVSEPNHPTDPTPPAGTSAAGHPPRQP